MYLFQRQISPHSYPPGHSSHKCRQPHPTPVHNALLTMPFFSYFWIRAVTAGNSSVWETRTWTNTAISGRGWIAPQTKGWQLTEPPLSMQWRQRVQEGRDPSEGALSGIQRLRGTPAGCLALTSTLTLEAPFQNGHCWFPWMQKQGQSWGNVLSLQFSPT